MKFLLKLIFCLVLLTTLFIEINSKLSKNKANKTHRKNKSCFSLKNDHDSLAKCKILSKNSKFKSLHRTQGATCSLNLYICQSANNWYVREKGGEFKEASKEQKKVFPKKTHLMTKIA